VKILQKVLGGLLFLTHTVEQENADKPVFFLKFNLQHKLQLLNVQHNFCSVMCYIVLIWTLILLTLRN